MKLTMLVGFYVSAAIFIKALAVPDEERSEPNFGIKRESSSSVENGRLG
jgi:hypothetical protein